MLLLDEPTAALDPVAAREARHLIRQIAESGTAILLTTHNLYEAEQICDRVGIIQSGTLVAEGRPADLIRQAGAAVMQSLPHSSPAASWSRKPGSANPIWKTPISP